MCLGLGVGAGGPLNRSPWGAMNELLHLHGLCEFCLQNGDNHCADMGIQ